MADSENSRTLPSSTPGNLVLEVERFLADSASGEQCHGCRDVDPFLAEWNGWLEAHLEFARLCCLQQRLETQLLRTVERPQVELHIPGAKDPIVVDSEEEIDAWLQGAELAELRERARKELAIRQRNWDAVDELIGYSRAKEAEEAASIREAGLADGLWKTHVGSVRGATAKVHAILKHGAPDPRADEFPWPQIRSILLDLLGVCGASAINTPDP